MKKHILTVLLAAALACVMAVPAMAGIWTVTAGGRWRYDVYGRGTEDGMLKNQWAWLDGNSDGVSECYYFDADGYMAADTEVDGYTVNASGQWTVNGVVQTKIEGVSINSANAVDLTAEAPSELHYAEQFETAQTAGGLTWENGLRFKGGVDHLANVVLNLDKDYTTMTIVFAPEAGQTGKGTGRVTVSGLTSGKTIYNSRKFDVSNEPISATFNCGGEKAIRISVIRGFDILFNSVEGHYVIHKEPGV